MTDINIFQSCSCSTNGQINLYLEILFSVPVFFNHQSWEMEIACISIFAFLASPLISIAARAGKTPEKYWT